MLTASNFTREQWDEAPQYHGPGNQDKIIALDFDILSRIAEDETVKGAFKIDETGVMSVAPLRLGHLPAAFFKLEAERPELMAEHLPTDDETIVVINGVLKLVYESGYRRAGNRRFTGMYYSGQTVNIDHGKVNMEPISVMPPASCLALAVYHDVAVDLGVRDVPLLRSF